MAVNPKSGFGSSAWTSEQNLEAFLEKWGNALLATARRYSPTPTDADDAYQRAVEILLTKSPAHESAEHCVAWMHTVVRNEALQLHRPAKKIVDAEFEKISEALVADAPAPDEAFELDEELAWGREALARIRPEQTRCLLLKADGLTNPEICEVTGFSYAKVNRLLSEGRKALGLRVTAIAGGRECERVQPLLLLMANDDADAAATSDAKLHLEHCAACRATLRDLRDAPSSLAALFPVGTMFVADRSLAGSIVDHVNVWVGSVQERLFGHATTGGEVVTAKKLAAGASIVAALAGGAVVIERGVDSDRPHAVSSVPATDGVKDGPLFDELKVDKPAARKKRVARQSRTEREGEDNRRAIEANDSAAQDPREITQVPEGSGMSGDPNDAVPESAPEDTGFNVGLDQ